MTDQEFNARFQGFAWISEPDHSLHFSIPGFLAKLGVADTAENRQAAEDLCRRTFAELLPGTDVILQD
jgi:hypothetical protein